MKKVSEANPGIKALAKKAPEVVQKMGYTMQMGSQENYSPTNFKTKDAMLMAKAPNMSASAATMKSFNSSLTGVVGTGTDKSSEGKMNQSQFDKMQEEVRKNINASKGSFDKLITSDSLTNLNERGYVPKIDQKRYDKARSQMDLIEGTTGTSKRSIERIRENLDAYKKKQGVYSDSFLKKQR